MRIWLAFRAFFAVLFGHPWPPRALPEAAAEAPRSAAIEEAKRALESPAPPTPAPPPTPPPAPAVDVKAAVQAAEEGAAVRVLSVLQSGGRLLDFLSEDIDSYTDSDIGAAVRDVHRGLKKALADHFPLEPLRAEAEDAPVTVPVGFDPAEIRLTGNVVGSPPFSGRIKHRGWRVSAVRLPRGADHAGRVVAPAEVEL